MKFILTLCLLFLSTLFFGQSKNEQPAMFLDSVFVANNTLEYMEPSEIKTINVIKKNTTINGVQYYGQIYITSRNPKKYDFISLEQVKSEFTKIKSNDVIYMINGALIKNNIETLKLDRNYILSVEVTNSDTFYNLRKSNIQFDIINILGKTKENFDNKNKILLRGYEAIGIR